MNALVGALRGRPYRPFHGTGWLRRWLWFGKVVETGHSLLGVWMLVGAATSLVDGDVRSAALTSLINVVANLYPVFVQRYNRARLLRIAGRMRGNTARQ